VIGGVRPLAAAARLAGRRGRVVLHSARDDDGLGQATYVGADPIATLEVRGRQVIERDRRGGVVKEREGGGDPLVAIEAFARAHGADLRMAVPTLVAPAVIGYVGYEVGQAIEPSGRSSTSTSTSTSTSGRSSTRGDPPDVWLGAYPAIAAWMGDAPGIVLGDTAEAAALEGALANGPDHAGPPPRFGPLVAEDADGAAHRARIARILEYIAAGDVYQVNLARRLVAPLVQAGDPLALYAALAEVAPAPFGALIEADEVTVVSGSPERFLTRRGQRIETRPIKGTRPRAADPAGDRAAAAELAGSAKDAAEHLMIVDLERNDLGRVAVTGSVEVERLAYLVELPQVHHLVSRIGATLRPNVGIAELLRATFPGGSITGAPKIRAMQIIDELEPVRRGPYCGAIGFFGGGGAIELAIAIRIAVITAGALHVHVGGGIVADSDPAAELAETEDKAAGWRAALARLAANPAGSL
jgi:para-aminobenzoate synthetase component I